MKNIILIALAVALYFTLGCASISLRENILEREKASVNRISTSKISSGYALLKGKYIGNEIGFKKNGIYEINYSEAILYLKIQRETSGLYFSVSDIPVKSEIDIENSDLNIIIGRLIGDSIMLGDINGGTPQLYIQLNELNGDINNLNSWALKSYNSLSGKVYYVYNGRIDEAEISAKLSVETGVKVINGIRSTGYLITVPFDIVTSPIQFIYFLYILDGALRDWH